VAQKASREYVVACCFHLETPEHLPPFLTEVRETQILYHIAKIILAPQKAETDPRREATQQASRVHANRKEESIYRGINSDWGKGVYKVKEKDALMDRSHHQIRHETLGGATVLNVRCPLRRLG
jgi:hypothetical protein